MRKRGKTRFYGVFTDRDYTTFIFVFLGLFLGSDPRSR